MKYYIYILTSFLLFASLGCNKNSAGDKRAELEALKKEQADINDKIRKIELELAASESPELRYKLVQVDTIQPSIFNHYIEIQGKVHADQNVTVSPQMPGSITAIYAREGDVVRAGQVLAEMDDRVVRQSAEEIKTQLILAEQLFGKQQNLWKQNIGSEVQYLQAKTQKEALEKRLQTLHEQLAMYKIKSPINGTVDEVNIKLGQSGAPGVPAFRVVNLSRLKVMAEVAESYSPSIKEGADAIIQFPDLQKETKSKIIFRSKTINPLNRTFTVHAELDEQNTYIPNQIAILKITDYSDSNALVVPVSAVQRTEAGSFVFLALEKDGKYYAQREKVETGRSYGGNVEITDGIKEGDKLITTGFDDINTGTPIKIAD